MQIKQMCIKTRVLQICILQDSFHSTGPAGVENIAHSLNHLGCSIRNLDLRLNDRLGSEGIAHIAVTIARGCNLTS